MGESKSHEYIGTRPLFVKELTVPGISCKTYHDQISYEYIDPNLYYQVFLPAHTYTRMFKCVMKILYVHFVLNKGY